MVNNVESVRTLDQVAVYQNEACSIYSDGH